uniref:Uncharacterized protein n=1 Tax=Rhizophora mucronata TaxID=61149 RepID=A0A2P2NBF8_RHIMU
MIVTVFFPCICYLNLALMYSVSEYKN